MPFIPLADAAEPCNKLDPMYRDTKRAIEITKKFISDRGLICYGGTALDYASRLAGSKIYDDSKLDLPDLDFFSIDPLKDSRDLADILFQNGYTGARSFNAMHVGTMRVDCGENHFIADISYCPIISEIKTMKYESFLIVDPIYQRIDMHSSLSFPYDNPPIEVIFNRWNKDTERFNIIDGLYPIKSNVVAPMAAQKSMILQQGPVYTGQIAYNSFVHNQLFGHVNVIEICSMDIEVTIKDLGLKLVSGYEQYFNLLPDLAFCVDETGGQKYIIYDISDKLMSYNSVKSDDTRHRISCGNFTLKMILGWLLVSEAGRVSWPWRPDYCDLGPDIMKAMYVELLNRTTLSIDVYGTNNISHLALINLEKQEQNMKGNTKYLTMYPLPETYRPSTGNARTGEPFNYRNNPLLCINGNIIA